MTTQIEDILNATCSSVKLTLSNDFQRVFVLSTASEAQLAFDILVTYGFDVKVYPQEDNTSKLYISHPTLSSAQLEKTLTTAKAYADTLKQVKISLDQLCNNEPAVGAVEYNLTFANLQPASKQIMIQISPARDVSVKVVDPDIVPVTNPTALAAARMSASRRNDKKDDGGFASGPAVGRGPVPGTPKEDVANEKMSLKRRIMLYIFGNMATSSYAALIMAIILGAVFSLFVFAKGFLCPDFASMQSSAWYCKSSGDNDSKQKKQQQQKQLGLPPS